jgi:phage shock protein PspC (stress-responsive transcriptional regulator)
LLEELVMQTAQPSVFARDHTLFGVCEALGEDLGFSPVFLRIAFAFALFFSPLGALAAYAALGVLVAFTRFVAPVPRRAAEPEAETAEAQAEAAGADPDMALAA